MMLLSMLQFVYNVFSINLIDICVNMMEHQLIFFALFVKLRIMVMRLLK
jgi:hypothetical protein